MAGEKDAVFKASHRIKQLNDLDEDVIRLLKSAGLAVKSLTQSTAASAYDSADQVSSVEQQKESFKAITSSYFTLLSSLDVRLRRQIYALEEAAILLPETINKDLSALVSVPSTGLSAGNGMNAPLPKHTGKGTITGGGLGSLDVGWLNSRHDHVGKEKEAELWEEARKFVSSVEGSRGIITGMAEQAPEVHKHDDQREECSPSQIIQPNAMEI